MALALVGLLGSAPVLAADLAPSSLRTCVQGFFADVVREERAQVLESPEPVFLLAGDTRVHPVHFEQAECRGFLAVGAKFTQDIELRVQNAEGRMLATGSGSSTTPYAFYCGQANETVFVTLRMIDGQGEVSFAVVSHLELDAHNLTRLTRCPGVGTARPAALDVGPEPRARTVDAEVLRVDAELSALGYRSPRLAAAGVLAAAQHRAHAISLEADHCYALAAVGGPDVADLDLRVFGPSISMQPIAEDATRHRNGLVTLCTDQARSYLLDVALFQGEGEYVVQLYDLDEQSERPPGILGNSRISYAETRWRMRDRGFSPGLASSGWSNADTPWTLPFELQAGHCYAFAAVGSHGLRAGQLTLTLVDEHQDVLAVDARPGQDPLAFVCPLRASQVRAVVQARGARASARFVMLFAQDPAYMAPVNR